MRYYLWLVKQRTDPRLWEELVRTEPDLLENTPTAHRRIRWDEIDNAECHLRNISIRTGIME
eukprot:COSAG01_NODE_4981_length_4573_cov_2.672105_3_plen_62_part_00